MCSHIDTIERILRKGRGTRSVLRIRERTSVRTQRPPPCCKMKETRSPVRTRKKGGGRYIKRKKKRVESPCLFPNGFYARQTVVGGPSHDMDAASLSLGSRESEITGIQVSADRVVS